MIARYLADVATGSGPDLMLADDRALTAMIEAGAIVELDAAIRERLADVSDVAITGASAGGSLHPCLSGRGRHAIRQCDDPDPARHDRGAAQRG
jgi:hypothetical protein